MDILEIITTIERLFPDIKLHESSWSKKYDEPVTRLMSRSLTVQVYSKRCTIRLKTRGWGGTRIITLKGKTFNKTEMRQILRTFRRKLSPKERKDMNNPL